MEVLSKGVNSMLTVHCLFALVAFIFACICVAGDKGRSLLSWAVAILAFMQVLGCVR